jgi:hypothetical protein
MAAERAFDRSERCGALKPTTVTVITASATHITSASAMPCE